MKSFPPSELISRFKNFIGLVLLNSSYSNLLTRYGCILPAIVTNTSCFNFELLGCILSTPRIPNERFVSKRTRELHPPSSNTCFTRCHEDKRTPFSIHNRAGPSVPLTVGTHTDLVTCFGGQEADRFLTILLAACKCAKGC
jgi:hypothetical protein